MVLQSHVHTASVAIPKGKTYLLGFWVQDLTNFLWKILLRQLQKDFKQQWTNARVMCRKLKILEIVVNVHVTLPGKLASSVLGYDVGHIEFFGPVFSSTRNISCLSLQKPPQLDKEQSFFSLSVERNARETEMKKERLIACVQTPPLPSRKNGEIEFS